MIKFKISPVLVLGVLMGVLGVKATSASAQTTPPATPSIYDQFNSAKVAYVTNEAEFYAAYQLLTNLPTSGSGDIVPAVIRFIKPGIYQLGDVSNIEGAVTVSIQGPGSFYMDPSGSTTVTDPRTLGYGVTIVGGGPTNPYRFINVNGGQNISLSGLTLLGFSNRYNTYFGEGPSWTNNTFYPNAYGGTIYNAGTLTLTNVTIASSTVTAYKSTIAVSTTGAATPDATRVGGSALGGAIYNTGTLTMRGCTLFNNSVTTDAFDDGTAALGGAIYSTGTLDVANCTFDNNHAYGTTLNYGTYPLAGTQGSKLIAGGRVAGGGSIAIAGGTATMQNITVTDSSAEAGYAQTLTDGAYGGGVYWASGFTAPWNSIFLGNTTSLTGVRSSFQYTPPVPFVPQFKEVPSSDGTTPAGTIGPNVASGTSGDFGLGTAMFTYGLGGQHNVSDRLGVASSTSGITFSSVSINDLTPLQDNGGPTLTRAPVAPTSLLVDNGSQPHEGDTPATIAAYLGGIDQRGAQRIVLGANPNDANESNGTPIVDIGAVEAQFDPTTGALIQQGGDTAPFIERASDAGTTSQDAANGDPNHTVVVSGVSVQDADSYNSADPTVHSEIVQVTINFPDGKIMTDFSGMPGITVISATDQNVVLQGTIDAINAALAGGITLYRADATADYPPDFSITVNDLGNTGYGGDQVATDISTHDLIDPAFNPIVYIQSVNHPPYVSAPGTQYVKVNANSSSGNTLVFSTANGNAINVGDPDINAPIDTTTGQGSALPPGFDRSGLQMQVTLSVANGTLAIGGSGSGITVTNQSSSNNGSSSVTIQGTVTDLNTALNGLTYQPNAGTVQDTLTITVNDLGNYGTGGPLTATATVLIKGNNDGSGSSKSSNVRWQVSSTSISGNTVEFTYTLINLSDTDITNVVINGSILGSGFFDTGDASFTPSVGYQSDVNQADASPAIQRQLDPTKNGLVVTWSLTDANGNAYIVRQGQNVFLRVDVPISDGAIGKQIANSWNVSFTMVDPTGNAVNPAPTPPVIIQP